MFGMVGCSLSLLGLADFGGFALLAFALALLGLCDLSLVIFQRTTDTVLEVNPRRLAAALDRGQFAVLFATAYALTVYAAFRQPP